MPATIYATFANEGNAERAAGALMDRGIAKDHISFILPDRFEAAMPPDELEPGIATVPPPANPPLTADQMTSAMPLVPPPPPLPDIPVTESERIAQQQARPGYRYDALGAVIPDKPGIVNEQGVAVTHVPSDKTVLAADTYIDDVNADHSHIIDMNRRQPHAAAGISTTTARDAGKGALEGGGIGLGLGVLLGLATVAIPGIGLVAGAGALVAGLTAATGVAGGIAGGVYGYLHDMGLPPDVAQRLSENLRAGGPVLSIEITGEIPSDEIISVVRKYGATSTEAF
jgi:hypothetical protein